MRVRSLRWLVVFGIAAIAFGAVGYSVAEAQAVEKLPDAEVHPAADESKAPDWSGSGDHPGKADFDQYCRLCHSMNETMKTGPGLLNIGKRVAEGPSHQGRSVVQRLLEFIKTTRQGGEENYSDDPYFRSVQEQVAGPGVQMSDRGGLPEDVTDRQILNIIDYMLRFRDVDFDEARYWREVKQGRALVGGTTPFQWGGPACTSCHSIGSDRDLMGANIGQNIAHTYVLMREMGSDEKNNYTDGLEAILHGEDAPAAHHFYEDVEGSRPLTPAELKALATFFEQAARDTGTEKDSNYLPIFALLFAALGIILLEPGVVNILFAKEHGEYVDGPYKEDDHHGHDDHEEKAEDKPADSAASDGSSDAKPDESADAPEKAEEEKPDASDAEPEDKAEEKGEDAADSEADKPAEEVKAGDAKDDEQPAESKDTEYSPKPEASTDAGESDESTAAKTEEPKSEDRSEKTDESDEDKKEDS